MLKKLSYIFDKKSKVKIFIILILIIIGGFLEMLGVTVFYPFVEMMMNPQSIDNIEILQIVFNLFAITGEVPRITVIASGIILLYLIKNIFLIFMQNKILTFNYSCLHIWQNLMTFI